MKATLVSLKPSQASAEANRAALCAELLASVAAKTSRDDGGLEAILSLIDPSREDKAIDTIFRHVDYGHQSIADMVPVAIFLDGVTLALAYYIFSVCPTGAGQESSTRYIRMTSLPTASELFLPDDRISLWQDFIAESFAAYEDALGFWTELAHQQPTLVRIPSKLSSDPSDKAQKAVERMKRNFAFDRARCFLPLAAKTNMVLIMSARGWARLRRMLLSHPLREANEAGEIIGQEMKLEMPRMMRHSTQCHSTTKALLDELDEAALLAHQHGKFALDGRKTWEVEDIPSLDVMLPPRLRPAQLSEALSNHSTRYAPIGSALRRTAVRFAWEGMGLAEIRDLNRHRTGEKYCPPSPVGFHAALDQIPPEFQDTEGSRKVFAAQQRLGALTCEFTRGRLLARAADHPYWNLLGTQFFYEHTTTANQFIYEMELRTGTGAHYRYAAHCRAMLDQWYIRFPQTKGLILEGSAEPE